MILKIDILITYHFIIILLLLLLLLFSTLLRQKYVYMKLCRPNETLKSSFQPNDPLGYQKYNLFLCVFFCFVFFWNTLR